MLISPAATCEEARGAFRRPVMVRGHWNKPEAGREKFLDALSMTVAGRALRRKLRERARLSGAERLPEAASGAAGAGI